MPTPLWAVLIGVSHAIAAGCAASTPPGPATTLNEAATVEPRLGAELMLLDPGAWPAGLSGLARIDETRWLAVGDRRGRAVVFRLDAAADRLGSLQPIVERRFTLEGGVDVEGVAVEPGGEAAWVVDEDGPRLTRHRLDDGSRLGTPRPLPDAFQATRPNLALESLARADDGALWTANESALPADGPAGPGGWVRLLRLGGVGEPDRQFAYPLSGPVDRWLITPVTGVTGLAALPDGRLLVLERAVGAQLRDAALVYAARSRVFLVNAAGATDVSAVESLVAPGAAFTAVRKTLLWQGHFRDVNFEGIALVALERDEQAEAGSPTRAAVMLLADDGDLPARGFDLGILRRRIEAQAMDPALAVVSFPLPPAAR